MYVHYASRAPIAYRDLRAIPLIFTLSFYKTNATFFRFISIVAACETTGISSHLAPLVFFKTALCENSSTATGGNRYSGETKATDSLDNYLFPRCLYNNILSVTLFSAFSGFPFFFVSSFLFSRNENRNERRNDHRIDNLYFASEQVR